MREIDVAINGEDGAAKQASLCDLVAQIKGLKQLVTAWRKDCQRYESALKKIRTFANDCVKTCELEHDKANWFQVSYLIGETLTQNDNCDICGDYHEPDNIPRSCETGDGD